MDIIHIEKYYDKIKERYPELSEKQIERIVNRGLRAFFMVNDKGGDVLLKSPAFTAYTGKMFIFNEARYKYWYYKKKIKLRFIYRWKKTQYSGYSYFGLNEHDYKLYKNKIGKSGRRRKKIKFENIRLYKIPDECFLNRGLKYFFKVEIDEQDRFEKFLPVLEIKDFELIYKRKADKTLEPVSNE